MAALMALLLVMPASADRVFRTFKGSKLPQGVVRADWLYTPSTELSEFWLGYGLSEIFAIELTALDRPGETTRFSGNFTYNFILPITDFTPGISFGLADLADETRLGTAGYMAITFRSGNFGDANQDLPTDLSIGVAFGRETRAFVGAELPFSRQFSLALEYDGFDPAVGFRVSPLTGLQAVFLVQPNQTSLGLQFRRRF